MKRSWKRTRIWKRLVSGMLTAVMLVTMLPTAAYAALLDNAPDQNRQILEELTAFWGDEKTAQEAMELLRQYGLIDEEGDILTDWTGKISIQEESRPLTIGQARAMSQGDVTVNGRACGLAELNAVLDGMEELGLLVDDVPAAHWQLQVDGRAVAPAGLNAALDGWTAPAVPEPPTEGPETPELPEETQPDPADDPAEPTVPDPGQDLDEPGEPAAPDSGQGAGPAQQPEQPEEPDTPQETPTDPPAQLPELPQGAGAGSPEQAGGILAALGRFFGVGAPAAAPAAPVVTVLGREVDSGELLDLIAFLDQYGLLTDTGAASDWGLTLPGGERETDLTELLAMLESGDYAPDMVISVDGTPITMADFKTMMEIQKEVERIRDTYLEDEVELTPEQAESLYSLYQQLQADGIQLYDTRAADGLEFPSGVNQALRVQVPNSVTFDCDHPGILDPEGITSPGIPSGLIFHGCALLNAKENDEVQVKISLLGGTSDVGPVFYDDDSRECTVSLTKAQDIADQTIKYNNDGDCWNGNRVYAIRYEAPGVIFQTTDEREVANAITIPLYVSASDHFLSADEIDSMLNWDFDRGEGGNDGATALGVGSTTMTVDGENYIAFGKGEFASSSWPRYMLDTYNEFWVERDLTENEKDAIRDGTITHASVSWDTARGGKGYNATFYIDEGDISTWASGECMTARDGDLEFIGPYEFIWDGKYDKVDKFEITDPDACIAYGSIRINKLTDQEAQTERDGKTGDLLVRSSGIQLTDERDPTIVSVAAPAGSYHYNDRVPITVAFSEPVRADGLKLTANGTELTPASSGTGKTHTFLYEVPAAGNTFLDVTSIWGAEDVTGRTMGTDDTEHRVLPTGSLEAASMLAAVPMPEKIKVGDLTYTPAQGDVPEKTTATVKVTLDLPRDERLRELILSGVYALDNNGFACGQLAASMDKGTTLIPLVLDDGTAPTEMTATVELDARTLIGQQTFVMEFYHITVKENDAGGVESIQADELFFGRYAAFSAQEPVPLTGENITVARPEGWRDNIYVNDPPPAAQLTLSGAVTGSGYTWSQTRWMTSDETVANISLSGEVQPLKAGQVEFWLEAVNGGLEEYQGEEYQSERISLTIQEGADPYLRIPEDQITIRSGDPLTLRWASNLVQKNRDFADNASTDFEIKVYKGREATGDPVQTYTVTYDPAQENGTITMGDGTTTIPMWIVGEDGTLTPNQSFVIQGLNDTHSAGFTITISAQAAQGVPNADADGYSAQTHVTVISKPVSVHLERPPGCSSPTGRTRWIFPIPWTTLT